MSALNLLIDSRFMRRLSLTALLLVGAVWLIIRFVGLESVPHGFWMDETWDATHVMCLAESGHDADGKEWPLVSNGLAGGSLPLTWTAQLVLWTRLFGTSIAAFRSISALWVALSCIGLFGVARVLLRLAPPWRSETPGYPGAEAFPWLVLLAALVSPWSFQFSRISWEQPLAPLFLVLTLLTLLHLKRSGNLGWAIVCGFCGACCMITYPPFRASVPFELTYCGLVLLALGPCGIHGRGRWLIGLVVTAVVLALVFSPIALALLRGEQTGRMMAVSIFSPDWLRQHRGTSSSEAYLVIALLDNIWLQLRPSYLFIVGDQNLRHSAHIVGQLSPVDMLAVLLVVVALVLTARLALRQMRGLCVETWPRLDQCQLMLMVVAGSCVVLGLFASVPSALTWDGVPHALRSIGAWPFVALFTGAVLALGWSRWRWLMHITAFVAVVYSVYFLPEYFRVYEKTDTSVFHGDITDAIAAGNAANPRKPVRESLRPLTRSYGDFIMRYFLMHDGGYSCKEAVSVYKEMRDSK